MDVKDDLIFNEEFLFLLKDYVGCLMLMMLICNLVSNLKVKLYLKCEDLLYGGVYKIN